MHNVLCIDEILRVVFESLQESDLYQIALTCKAFLEPALDGLWNVLQDPDDLFRLLPDDAIYDPATNDYSSSLPQTVVLVRSLSPDEWGRFDYYAKRIRCAYFLTPDPLPPLMQMYLQTSVERRSTPLLPNVSSIYLESAFALADVAALFLSPSLRELDIQDCAEDLYLNKSFVEGFTNIIPALTSLSLSAIDIADGMCDALRTAGTLTSIQLADSADWEIIRILGSLPLLQNLVVDECDDDGGAQRDIRGVFPWFPSLQSIWAQIDVVLPVLSGIKSGGSVTLVSIAQLEAYGSPSSDPLDITPLQHCSQMRGFKLASPGARDPSDKQYLTLAKKWPELRHIVINGQHSTSLATLKALSEHCPKLERITVDLEWHRRLGKGFRFGKLPFLTTLDLGRVCKGTSFFKVVWAQLSGKRANLWRDAA